MRTRLARFDPGMVQVFRLFVGARFVLLMLALCARNPRVPHYPGLGLLETGFLLGYLSWRWPQRWLGRAYLPLALVIATFGPIIEQVTTVSLRVREGLGPVEAGSDSWQLIVVVGVPFVLAAWQYGFAAMVGLMLPASLLALLLAIPLALRGGPRWISTAGLVFAWIVLYLILGYLIARLAAAGRSQREELARLNTQLTDYAATVERLTASHERNRLARELHDTLAHTLSAVSVQLEALEAVWEDDPAAARDTLRRAQELTRNGLHEARRALKDLRARPLEDLGLALAVRRAAEQSAARAGLTLTGAIQNDLGTLPAATEQTIYRVAEEAMANVVRHANARTLHVGLSRANGRIVLEVIDDGRGFDMKAQTRQSGHFGLVGMQERAALCGGKLAVISAPDAGTVVRLEIEEQA